MTRKLSDKEESHLAQMLRQSNGITRTRDTLALILREAEIDVSTPEMQAALDTLTAPVAYMGSIRYEDGIRYGKTVMRDTVINNLGLTDFFL